jgi:hypothetical protein
MKTFQQFFSNCLVVQDFKFTWQPNYWNTLPNLSIFPSLIAIDLSEKYVKWEGAGWNSKIIGVFDKLVDKLLWPRTRYSKQSIYIITKKTKAYIMLDS